MFSGKLYLGLFILGSAMAAENRPGTITGTITDWDGAPLAKAEVLAKNVPGVQFHATSTETGAYTLDHLPPGTYQISITAEGLMPYEKVGVVVQESRTIRLDARLEDFDLNTFGEDRDFFADILFKRHEVPPGPAPRLSSGQLDFSGVWRAQRTVEPGMPEMMPWAEAVTKARVEKRPEGCAIVTVPSERCALAGNVLALPYCADAEYPSDLLTGSISNPGNVARLPAGSRAPI